MKPIIAGVLVSLASVGLLSACGSDDKSTIPPTTASAAAVDTTLAAGSAAPDGTIPASIPGSIPASITIPAGAIPSDLSIPEQAIDQMMAQFEASGLKVDRACFTALLQDPSLRELIAAGGTPSPEVFQKFTSCMTP